MTVEESGTYEVELMTVDRLRSGAINLGDKRLTVGGDNSSTEFSGVASRVGGITKSGTGKQILSGANTYTGQTLINGGTLLVSGSLSDETALTVEESEHM